MFIRAKTNNWTVDLSYLKLIGSRASHFNGMTCNIWQKILNTQQSGRVEACISKLRRELADQTVGAECIDNLAQITETGWGIHDHQNKN